MYWGDAHGALLLNIGTTPVIRRRASTQAPVKSSGVRPGRVGIACVREAHNAQMVHQLHEPNKQVGEHLGVLSVVPCARWPLHSLAAATSRTLVQSCSHGLQSTRCLRRCLTAFAPRLVGASWRRAGAPRFLSASCMGTVWHACSSLSPL